jgi:glycosyltransferase involved in cell wall biosynthesis
MAFGVPVIATRAGGNLDLITDGGNGYLFDDNDPRELAARIMGVIEHPWRLPPIVERARHTATVTFALTRTIAAYEQLFQYLIGRSESMNS